MCREGFGGGINWITVGNSKKLLLFQWKDFQKKLEESNNMNDQQKELLKQLKDVIPQNGLIFSEQDMNKEILCKPKILPLKSLTLQKLEDMEKQMLN